MNTMRGTVFYFDFRVSIGVTNTKNSVGLGRSWNKSALKKGPFVGKM